MSAIFDCTTVNPFCERVHQQSQMFPHATASSQGKDRHRQLLFAEFDVLGSAHRSRTVIGKPSAHPTGPRITLHGAVPFRARDSFGVLRFMDEEPIKEFPLAPP